MNITPHAQQRFQQRGLKSEDLDLIVKHGTEITDGYFLRRTDVQAVEQSLKRLIERLYKLEGRFVVVEGNDVITTYNPTRKKKQRILRRRIN